MPATRSVPPTPLTLEEYAAVAARLLQSPGRPTADVLAELGLSVDAWLVSATAWESALDEELARGKDTLLVAFTARFVSTRAAISRRPAPALPAEPATTRREPALRRTAIPDVPNLPIRSGTTMAVDPRQSARPVLPFAPIPSHADDDDGTRRAASGVGLPFVRPSSNTPEPSLPIEAPPTMRVPGASEPSLLIEPATLRLDSRWPPPAPEPWLPAPPKTLRLDSRWPPPAPEPEADVPIPLVRIKHPPRSSAWTWMERLRRWLWDLLRPP